MFEKSVNGYESILDVLSENAIEFDGLTRGVGPFGW